MAGATTSFRSISAMAVGGDHFQYLHMTVCFIDPIVDGETVKNGNLHLSILCIRVAEVGMNGGEIPESVKMLNKSSPPRRRQAQQQFQSGQIDQQPIFHRGPVIPADASRRLRERPIGPGSYRRSCLPAAA